MESWLSHSTSWKSANTKGDCWVLSISSCYQGIINVDTWPLMAIICNFARQCWINSLWDHVEPDVIAFIVKTLTKTLHCSMDWKWVSDSQYCTYWLSYFIIRPSLAPSWDRKWITCMRHWWIFITLYVLVFNCSAMSFTDCSTCFSLANTQSTYRFGCVWCNGRCQPKSSPPDQQTCDSNCPSPMITDVSIPFVFIDYHPFS